MKSWAIMPFLTAFLIFAVARGSGSPANTGFTQSSDDIKSAAQQMFNAWLEATQNRDAPAMYALLARNITDRCTLEQLEQLLATDDDAFTYPELYLKGVFLGPANPKQAMIAMKLRNEPRPGREGDFAVAASLPFPIFREDDRWLMGLHFVVVGDGCPFVGESKTQAATEAATSTGQ